MNEHQVVWIHGLRPEDRALLVAAFADLPPTDSAVHWAGPRLEDLEGHTEACVGEHDAWPEPDAIAPDDLLVVDASGMAPSELAARLRERCVGCTVVLREAGQWTADLQVAQPEVHAAELPLTRPALVDHAPETAWVHVPSGLAGAVAEGLGQFADYWVGDAPAPQTAGMSEVLSVVDLQDLADAHRCEWPSDSVFVVDGRGMSRDTLRAALDAVPLTDGMEWQGIDISERNGNRILVLREAGDLGPDARAFAATTPTSRSVARSAGRREDRRVMRCGPARAASAARRGAS
jgi:hypothetical protein